MTHHSFFILLMMKKCLVLVVFFLGLVTVDGPAAPESADGNLFCFTYEGCRALFRADARAKGAQLSTLSVPSKVDSDLTIDVAYFPAKGKPKDLIVITSGVHGIEGYAGSLVQRLFLQETIAKLNREHTGVLLVHGINPYGMKYGRRVTENNVDLNRNFEVDRSLFATPNEGYVKLAPLLNPTEPARFGETAKLGFYWNTGRLLMREPLAVLRQAVMQGQYQFDHGLYFGGKDFEPQKEMLEKLLLEKAAAYEQVLLMDVHTGYGSRGVLHILGDLPQSGPEKELYEGLFAGFVSREMAQKDQYQNKGGFSDWIGKLLRARGKRAVALELEYGTVDNQSALGGIASLRTMVLENQLFWHGASDNETTKGIRRQFYEMYFPRGTSWRNKFLTETRKLVPTVTSRLAGEVQPLECRERFGQVK